MAIGRPISLTPNIATKAISEVATADQTDFTVTDGYRINEIAVYRNGVRLAEGRDFTASDGSTVQLVTGATESDVIEFAVFDSFNIADAIVSAASSQTVSGDLNITGKLYSGALAPNSFDTGIGTFITALHVGTALTANAAGDVESIGIITAASFSGDGSALTGLANTDYVVSVATTTGDLKVGAAVTVGGIVNIDATTDSTSVTTGALIVDGGLGVAKNVYIGAGLSVAGTLTYEDVTNVDSVGVVTAKSGVNVSGGQLLVGSGITMGIAGVATFSGTGDVHLHDDVKILLGTGGDGEIYHSAADNRTYIRETGGGALAIQGDYIKLQKVDGSEDMAVFQNDGPVQLYHNNIKTFETIGTGITIYGPEGGNGTILISADEGDDNADKFGMLVNTSGAFFLQNYSSGSWGNNLKATGGGSVELYHNTVKTFETKSNGVIVQGTENENAELLLYADEGDDNADQWRIKADTNGQLEISNYASGSYEKNIECNGNGNVELYYDSSLKLETTTTGVTITGNATATKFLGDGSALTGVGGEFDITSCLFV